MKTMTNSQGNRRRAARLAGMLVAQLAAVSLLIAAPAPEAQARGRSKKAPKKSSSQNNNNNNSRAKSRPQGSGQSQAAPRGNGRSGNVPRGNAYGRSDGNTNNRGNAYGRGNNNGRGNSNGQARGNNGNNANGRGNGNAYGRSGATPRGNANGHANPAPRSNGRQGSGHVSTRSSRAPSGHVHSYYRGRCTSCRTRYVGPGYRTSYYQPHRSYVVNQGYSTYYAAPQPASTTAIYHSPVGDSFDLGAGLGLVYAAPQLESGLPMVNGKIRMLGQVTPRLGLGIDLDVGSMVFVNHATASAVMSFDLIESSQMALRPYVSLGGGALHLYDQGSHFWGPALSARAGVELKPISWIGLSVEGGGVGTMRQGSPLTVPYLGGTLSLYVL